MTPYPCSYCHREFASETGLMRHNCRDAMKLQLAPASPSQPSKPITSDGGLDAKGLSEGDAVHHPKHYTSHPSGVECIQVTRHMSFNLGNATKYIWRADLNNDAIEDLEKAVWYLRDEIEKRKNAAPTPER